MNNSCIYCNLNSTLSATGKCICDNNLNVYVSETGGC